MVRKRRIRRAEKKYQKWRRLEKGENKKGWKEEDKKKISLVVGAPLFNKW